jgi:hypothetical protein
LDTHPSDAKRNDTYSETDRTANIQNATAG